MSRYRDTATLKLAAEINDFVRSKTKDSTVASVALEVARVSFSLVEWPISEADPKCIPAPQQSDPTS
jgi:hypothetical protein